MASDLKPIKLYGGVLGPNPKKVAIILEELNLPFEREYIDFANVKTPDYEAINPNGRLPAITDPNTGITLWESGAIIEYLISKYDKASKLSFPEGRTESYHVKQWFYFQVSGQGPYYGQAYWFKNTHPEKLQSAIDRYVKEIHRVSKVLDKWLEKREWLVGDKCTYADLAFIPWQTTVPFATGDAFDPVKEFPNVHAWMERMKGRPAVSKILQEADEKRAAQAKK